MESPVLDPAAQALSALPLVFTHRTTDIPFAPAGIVKPVPKLGQSHEINKRRIRWPTQKSALTQRAPAFHQIRRSTAALTARDLRDKVEIACQCGHAGCSTATVNV